MECSVAIQVLPMDAANDEETCRVVDAVIAYIDASGLNYFVGPFETCIEGSYAACIEVLARCQTVAAQAGCGHVLTYAKINYRPSGNVMSTEGKIAKYHEDDGMYHEANGMLADATPAQSAAGMSHEGA